MLRGCKYYLRVVLAASTLHGDYHGNLTTRYTIRSSDYYTGTSTMTRPLPMKFIPQTAIKVLRVERGSCVSLDVLECWRIWMTANGDFTLGTYIELCDNGDVNRVTWHEDGTETVFRITEDE
jgi:hypothetical protein